MTTGHIPDIPGGLMVYLLDVTVAQGSNCWACQHFLLSSCVTASVVWAKPAETRSPHNTRWLTCFFSFINLAKAPSSAHSSSVLGRVAKLLFTFLCHDFSLTRKENAQIPLKLLPPKRKGIYRSLLGWVLYQVACTLSRGRPSAGLQTAARE